jgi:hypothetical protein
MKMQVSKTLKAGVGAGLSVAAGLSQAAGGVDTAPIVSSLTEAGTAVGVIGAAVLGVVVIVKTFKYIRQAF